MTEAEALQEIAAKLKADWSECVVIYPGQSTPAPAGAHVVLVVRDLPNRSVTHGARDQRRVTRRALLIAQVYEPIADGQDTSLPALARAARFRAVLEGLDVPDTAGDEAVSFQDAVTNRIGVHLGKYYQVNVLIEHTYPSAF